MKMTNQKYTDKTEYLKLFQFYQRCNTDRLMKKRIILKCTHPIRPLLLISMWRGQAIIIEIAHKRGVGGGPVRPDTAHIHQIDYFCRVHMIRIGI